ncbi:hypothetical protein M3N64_08965 [Sporolactobacillus sp. CPB3-1]|uniref:Uncharacterized protein n=1 Tax=Sporolactobacillus mangiferae TaxID=2940498 RepID=A0ABT0MCP6_9BACL|nr:hypothetical protein [Sporolactobacillus mangiferae]MCL1632080.1 hypothetical protein [Sporolactobacillus mangiferae]
MNEKLWTLVQELVSQPHVNASDLAFAGAELDPDLAPVFVKHMNQEAATLNDPIEWA